MRIEDDRSWIHNAHAVADEGKRRFEGYLAAGGGRTYVGRRASSRVRCLRAWWVGWGIDHKERGIRRALHYSVTQFSFSHTGLLFVARNVCTLHYYRGRHEVEGRQHK